MKTLKHILLAAVLAATSCVSQAQVNRVTALPIIDNAGAGYANISGQKASYFAALGNNTPAATPTDVAILTGSSSKTITVTRVVVSVASTAASVIEYRLMKYSGGTQSAVNTAFAAGTHAGAYDSNDAASTVITAGLAGVYTSNPASSGTTVGIIEDWTVTSSSANALVLEYNCTRPSKCITLRGTTQVLAINGNGHTLATGEKVGVKFEWTEE